jgi:hypothetical protein
VDPERNIVTRSNETVLAFPYTFTMIRLSNGIVPLRLLCCSGWQLWAPLPLLVLTHPLTCFHATVKLQWVCGTPIPMGKRGCRLVRLSAGRWLSVLVDIYLTQCQRSLTRSVLLYLKRCLSGRVAAKNLHRDPRLRCSHPIANTRRVIPDLSRSRTSQR